MQNIIWKILERAELIALYQNEMARDFPPDEIRPLATLLELYDSARYCPYGVFSGEGLAAGATQYKLEYIINEA